MQTWLFVLKRRETGCGELSGSRSLLLAELLAQPGVMRERLRSWATPCSKEQERVSGGAAGALPGLLGQDSRPGRALGAVWEAACEQAPRSVWPEGGSESVRLRSERGLYSWSAGGKWPSRRGQASCQLRPSSPGDQSPPCLRLHLHLHLRSHLLNIHFCWERSLLPPSTPIH